MHRSGPKNSRLELVATAVVPRPRLPLDRADRAVRMVFDAAREQEKLHHGRGERDNIEARRYQLVTGAAAR